VIKVKKGFNKGSILMAVGIVLILISSVSAIAGWFSQQKLIRKYENDDNGAEAGIIESSNKPDPYDNIALLNGSIIKKYPSEKYRPYNRADYKTGMMIIDIPKLKVHAAVIGGTTQSDLKKGPCLFENSPLPDLSGGNVCLAAHRDRWFRYIDKLVKDDDVILEFNNKKYLYKVERVFVVAKNDWSVTYSTGYSALTLVTCISITSSEQRIIVRARLA
jgi:LPXTG-site transpeptidase (sortase) family protein